MARISAFIYISILLGVVWFVQFGKMIYHSIRTENWQKVNQAIVICNSTMVVIGIVLTIYCFLRAYGI